MNRPLPASTANSPPRLSRHTLYELGQKLLLVADTVKRQLDVVVPIVWDAVELAGRVAQQPVDVGGGDPPLPAPDARRPILARRAISATLSRAANWSMIRGRATCFCARFVIGGDRLETSTILSRDQGGDFLNKRSIPHPSRSANPMKVSVH